MKGTSHRASRIDINNPDEVILLGLTALFVSAELLSSVPRDPGVTMADLGRKAFQAADSILDAVAKRRDGIDDGPPADQ